MSYDKEMQAALFADGEKLRALTGEDHGPWTPEDSDELPPSFEPEDPAEVAELREQLATVRAALEPFASYMLGGGDLDHLGCPLPDDQGVGWVYLTMGDFRRATAALTPQVQP